MENCDAAELAEPTAKRSSNASHSKSAVDVGVTCGLPAAGVAPKREEGGVGSG